jgi:hypothetical protein
LGLGRRLRATGEATEHVEEGLSSPVDETTTVLEADPAVEVKELPARSEEEAPSVAVKEILEDDDDEHDFEVIYRVRVSSRDSFKARGRKRVVRIIRVPVLGILDAKRARRGCVTNHGSKNGKRALQHVSTMATQKAVVSCSGRIAKRLAELALLELASRGSEFLGLAEQLWASGVVWNRKRIVKTRAGRRRSCRTSRG